MSNIKKIRASLGLSQIELSVYLNVGRSFLNQVEKSNKQLSIEAINKVLQLQQVFEQNNILFVKDELDKQQELLAAFEQSTKQHNDFIKAKLQKKLDETILHYNKAVNILQSIRALKNQEKNLSTKDMLWCNAIEAQAIENINKNGLVEQKKLIQKINTLS